MAMRWIWIPTMGTLVALFGCGGGGNGVAAAEDLPRVYLQAMVEEDWPQVWNLFSVRAKELCSLDLFIQSRDWFREQSGDSYNFWLDSWTELSERDWEAEVSEGSATLRLREQDATID